MAIPPAFLKNMKHGDSEGAGDKKGSADEAESADTKKGVNPFAGGKNPFGKGKKKKKLPHSAKTDARKKALAAQFGKK